MKNMKKLILFLSLFWSAQPLIGITCISLSEERIQLETAKYLKSGKINQLVQSGIYGVSTLAMISYLLYNYKFNNSTSAEKEKHSKKETMDHILEAFASIGPDGIKKLSNLVPSEDDNSSSGLFSLSRMKTEFAWFVRNLLYTGGFGLASSCVYNLIPQSTKEFIHECAATNSIDCMLEKRTGMATAIRNLVRMLNRGSDVSGQELCSKINMIALRLEKVLGYMYYVVQRYEMEKDYSIEYEESEIIINSIRSNFSGFVKDVNELFSREIIVNKLEVLSCISKYLNNIVNDFEYFALIEDGIGISNYEERTIFTILRRLVNVK